MWAWSILITGFVRQLLTISFSAKISLNTNYKNSKTSDFTAYTMHKYLTLNLREIHEWFVQEKCKSACCLIICLLYRFCRKKKCAPCMFCLTMESLNYCKQSNCKRQTHVGSIHNSTLTCISELFCTVTVHSTTNFSTSKNTNIILCRDIQIVND